MSEHQGRFDTEKPDSPPASVRTELMDPNHLSPHPEGPVTLGDREGVFAQSFKCGDCQLEFVLLSWVSERHDAYNTYCPECGQITPKVHWRAKLSEHRDFVDDGSSIEIFNVIPLGRNARLVSFPDQT